MKRHQILVGAAVAALILLGLTAFVAHHTGPDAPGHTQAQEFSAGRLVVNLPHPFTHRFEFRNDTAERLEIAAIKPSCGCTKVEAPVQVFEPGESGWLEATATLHASGPFVTEVVVHWSTGEKTHYTLGAVAQVRRDLWLSTPSVDLDVSEPRTLVLTYVDQDGQAPGPISLVSPDKALKVDVGPWQSVIAVNKEYGIAAQYAANVSVELTESLDELSRVQFSLAASPDLQPVELVVRTPALARSYALKHHTKRSGTGPIVIEHAAEPGASADSTVADHP